MAQEPRERSANNPRLVGSLEATVAANKNPGGTAGGLKPAHRFKQGGQLQSNSHNQSAAQFAHLDLLTNYEPNQSIFSG